MTRRPLVAALALGCLLLFGPVSRAAALACACHLDCGCSLAREYGVTDRAQARRLWLAHNWLREFARVASPVDGDAVVLSRGRKGHVGKFRGFDANGNPIVESFKCRGSIGAHAYPRGRVLGYVRP